jgi:hypothetical protein
VQRKERSSAAAEALAQHLTEQETNVTAIVALVAVSTSVVVDIEEKRREFAAPVDYAEPISNKTVISHSFKIRVTCNSYSPQQKAIELGLAEVGQDWRKILQFVGESKQMMTTLISIHPSQKYLLYLCRLSCTAGPEAEVKVLLAVVAVDKGFLVGHRQRKIAAESFAVES